MGHSLAQKCKCRQQKKEVPLDTSFYASEGNIVFRTPVPQLTKCHALLKIISFSTKW